MSADVVDALQESRRLLWAQWAALDRLPNKDHEAIARARRLAEGLDSHLTANGVPL